MNHNNSVSNNQSFSEECLNVIYHMGGILPATFVPIEVSRRMSSKRISSIDKIINFIRWHDKAFPSQVLIANMLKIDRGTVALAIKDAIEMGLLEIKENLGAHTPIYILGPKLMIPWVRYALREVLTNVNGAIEAMTLRAAKLFGGMLDYFGIKQSSPRMQGHAFNKEKSLVQMLTPALYTNVLDFKKNYTSKYIYKERRLYSTPFLKKESWMNKQKAMWADWSLTEEDFKKDDTVTNEEYKKFYQKSDIPVNELQQKIALQAQQQRSNRSRFPNDMTGYQNYKRPLETKAVILKNKEVLSTIDFQKQTDLIALEMNLSLRLELYQQLLHKTPGASIPFVQHMIRKTHQKINDKKNELPF